MLYLSATKHRIDLRSSRTIDGVTEVVIGVTCVHDELGFTFSNETAHCSEAGIYWSFKWGERKILSISQAKNATNNSEDTIARSNYCDTDSKANRECGNPSSLESVSKQPAVSLSEEILNQLKTIYNLSIVN